MATDPRFLADSGREIFTGNELLLKGALETTGGVSLLTGYPGSPVAGFFDLMGDLSDLLKKHGIRAFQANNEALGVAAVNGSQMVPCKAIVAFKSVGTHVASDALALGNMAGSHPDGGVVVVSGEDPWCDSTQVPADSRFLFEHLRMPVVEPGTAQELKDWVNLSFELSQAAGMYIGYIVTVAHADGGGSVDCRPNQWPKVNTNAKTELPTELIPVQKTVLLPPRTWQKELQTHERFAATIKRARELGVNKIVASCELRVASEGQNSSPASSPSLATRNSPLVTTPSSLATDNSQLATSPLGFIVTGTGSTYLNHVLNDIGLYGHFPVLRMGMSYPADVEMVAEFSKLCDKMIVIEERRSFLEKNIRDSAFALLDHATAVDITSRLYGKTFPNQGTHATEPSGYAAGSSSSIATGASSHNDRKEPAAEPLGSVPFRALSGVPSTRGLNPSVLAQVLIPLIKATEEIPAELRNGKLTAELSRLRELSRPKLQVFNDKVVSRTPTFCPGCPHRDSSAALLELRANLLDPAYMLKHHGTGPVDMVAHGDTGCYTMLMFAPTEQLMHNYSGMGLGAGTGSGIDPFITNKQIVFMGDGTFFHSGQVAISNAIKQGQDLTFIILENKTTAMTGHQEHAGTELDAMGNRSYIQDIEEICRAMAGTSPLTVTKLSPANRSTYRSVLEKNILSDGVKVIIADKECGITAQRKEKKRERAIIKEKGYLPKKTHMNVTPEVCENCLECTKATACPGLITIDTDYGRKIDTDLTWCVNDGACVRVTVSNDFGNQVKPCPSFEQVTVLRKKRRRYMLPNMELHKLPEPKHVHAMDTHGDAWRVHMAGVGGMGIGVVGAILIRAGHKEGYRVLFQDKKGLAIRNGGVYGQMTFILENAECRMQNAERREGNVTDSSSSFIIHHSSFCIPTTGAIPYGKADLLLGVDVLEAARAIDPREQFRVAHKSRTAAVLNLYKQPTVFALLGRSDFDPEALREEIYENCRADLSYAKDLSDLCEKRLGSKQFVNIMMLGVAFQLGLIPVSAWSIAWAIKDSIRRDHRKNLKAFNIGRKLALEPRALPKKPEPETWLHLVTNKGKILRKTRMFGRTHADAFEKIVQGAMKGMRELPEESKYDITLRIYDLLQYQDADFAKSYVEQVRAVFRRDSKERNYGATQAVIINLAKVMLIKDEPYVAYLLTRYEKKQRDLEKYAVDVANGDTLVYRHHTSPEFNVFGHRVRLKIDTRDWQLNLVRHMKWWRKLPGWHSREVAFRDWYTGIIGRVSLNDANYGASVQLLESPEEVTGYREVRYPKMEAVRARVDAELSRVPKMEMNVKRDVFDTLRTPTGV